MAHNELKLGDTETGHGVAQALLGDKVTSFTKAELLSTPVVQLIETTVTTLDTLPEGEKKESVKAIVSELRRLLDKNLDF